MNRDDERCKDRYRRPAHVERGPQNSVITKVTMLDKIKLALAAALVVAGVWGFYHFSDTAPVLRVLMVLGGLLAAGGVAWLTRAGQAVLRLRARRLVEAEKVSWPTRKETMQTTAVVFAFVVVMAIFLFAVDTSLAWMVKLATWAERGMSDKKWFVVHAYSGFEKSVQRALTERIKRAEHAATSSARSWCRSRKSSR